MIPEREWKGGRPPKYDFAKLKVGECLNIAEKDKGKSAQAASHYGKRHGKKFVSRKAGLEIWRKE